MRRPPRGDAALHPQGAQGAPFQWLTEEPESLVEIIFPGQDWIVMAADSPALPGISILDRHGSGIPRVIRDGFPSGMNCAG